MTPIGYAASGAALGALVFVLTELVKVIRDDRRTDPALVRRLKVEYGPRHGTLERRAVERRER